MKFPIKGFFQNMSPDLQFTADLVTFSEEVFNGKLHFLCSVIAANFRGAFKTMSNMCDGPVLQK